MLKKIWHPQPKFQNLKKLVVHNCEVLEYVFDHQGLNRDDGILPKIEVLELLELPKLRLTIYEDKNDNMPYHFSLFKFMALEHIKELYISNCGNPLDEKVSFLPYFFCFSLCHLKYLETFTININIFF